MFTNNLKVGDKVILNTGYRTVVTNVTRITPTGRIRVAALRDIQFNSNGEEIVGKNTWAAAYSFLEEWTQEKEDYLKKQKYERETIARVKDMFKKTTLSVSQAERILKILEENETEEI